MGEQTKKADGVLATVGLEADLSAPAPTAGATPGGPGGGPAVAPGASTQSTVGDAVAAGNIDK